MADLSTHYAYCENLVREQDKDRWLACLFAPEESRRRLFALYAFNAEIARVREAVSAPTPGEIRLQWWIDALQGEARGDVRANPVTDALIDVIRACRLPRQAFVDIIEARRFDLYDDPMETLPQLDAYCGHTSSALFRLAAIICADGEDPGGADAAGYGGLAYALTGLLRAFPRHAAEGRLYIPAHMLEAHGVATNAALMRPASAGLIATLAELRALAREHLARANAALKHVSSPARVAFVPLALAPLYLDALDRHAGEPFAETSVPQWRRQWELWRNKL
ncbi:MAG: squalene/phytoene synthase family protein [Hyphomicrobiales bacterium]|nr:squalene/phytoene synthase family protein [Hyphomicrobiales bacterium]